MATPEEQAQAMLRGIEEKTGRDLQQWKKLLASSGLTKHGEIVALLKKEHGVTHGYANLIAHETLRSAASHSEAGDLVAAQYAGKQDLLPIWRRIEERVGGFGDDVELAPKKAYVSLRRKKQFALVQPSTKTRVDVGIQLPGVAAGKRLEASGSFNSMVSHRVRLAAPGDVDEELIGWLRQAYEAAG
ncbi:MAG: DUF4287 domain-containing protein [Acidobacteria bacterium]|nr:MAG: DUF4287 domain-containing protein [Acidobacteriota bacterium]REK11232.1 MAG: DUF4287 domain-containing protein [Acidobacteriota bacterium]